MMHVRFVRPHKLSKIKLLTTYMVAYMRSLIYNIAGRATHFTVSVTTQEFHFSPTPQVYAENKNLGFRLQAKYFHIYTHIYTSISKLPKSKYVPYIHINMHVQSYQS